MNLSLKSISIEMKNSDNKGSLMWIFVTVTSCFLNVIYFVFVTWMAIILSLILKKKSYSEDNFFLDFIIIVYFRCEGFRNYISRCYQLQK